MANGKAGDHPLIDILHYKPMVYVEEGDILILNRCNQRFRLLDGVRPRFQGDQGL